MIFINDLPKSVGIPTELFADDALLHQASYPSSHLDLQEAIENAESWALSSHRKFGHPKAKVLRISPSRACTSELKHQSFFMDNNLLSVVSNHRHLGVILTSGLQWKVHIADVITKCSRKSRLLKWMSCEFPNAVVEKLYLHYLRPLLEYAAPVWQGSLNESDATALERMQCSVARRLLKAS